MVDMRDKKLAALKQTLEVERAQQTDIDVLLREVESLKVQKTMLAAQSRSM